MWPYLVNTTTPLIGPIFHGPKVVIWTGFHCTDMQLIPREKIHSSRDSVRKARESHLIDKAMTLEPHDRNRRDELL